MKAELIAFTQAGYDCACAFARVLPPLWEGAVARCFGAEKVPLQQWTREAFSRSDALIFVGATGIAVRSIAPYVTNKAHDPAVLVIDEAGTWVISLLSGHLGGANWLAKQLADAKGAQAVITTASDVRGVWAVDDWARERALAVIPPPQIKNVTSTLLAGGEVSFISDVELIGAPPVGLHILSTPIEIQNNFSEPLIVLSPFIIPQHASDISLPQQTLWLVPQCITVGLGCRRGASCKHILEAINQALKQAGVHSESVCSVRSIDLKRDEQGLLEACQAKGWGVEFLSATQLNAVEGDFSSSEFVQQVTGVNNVCERAALYQGGKLVLSKQVIGGVTVALAFKSPIYHWNEV